MPLRQVKAYALHWDFCRSSELDTCLAIPSLGHLELHLEATFRRSSQLVAYVQHLEPHQLPDRILSVTMSVEERILDAMSVQAALSSFSEASHRVDQVIGKRRIDTHGW